MAQVGFLFPNDLHLQNEDGVENTLGTPNYSLSLFCMKNAFVFEGRVVEITAS